MAWTDRQLKQKAVYWGSPSVDGYGDFSFASPVEIDCRWETKRDLYLDKEGFEKPCRSVVFVGQDLDVGGYLYLGELDDIDSSAVSDPLQVGAERIVSFEKIPSMKANVFVRKAKTI